MQWQQLVIDGYKRVYEILDKALNGLTMDDLNESPRPDCNSIGWLTWHLTRELDYNMAGLSGLEQIWIKDKWYARFKRTPNPFDTGFSKLGHSLEEVAAFKSPEVRTLLDYYSAALERLEQYVHTLSADDLDRKLDGPAWSYERKRRMRDDIETWYQPVPTLGMRLVTVLSECLQHAGQVAYVRGLLKGTGWLDV